MVIGSAKASVQFPVSHWWHQEGHLAKIDPVL